jgi:hypothetical protein
MLPYNKASIALAKPLATYFFLMASAVILPRLWVNPCLNSNEQSNDGSATFANTPGSTSIADHLTKDVNDHPMFEDPLSI